MENNNSKQVLLSIIGIAVLVIAVVGVSFAFFTYSKTGESNNVITTGSIQFSFKDANNNIVVTNQFPKTAEEGVKNTSFDFQVVGTVPNGTDAVAYSVFALQGADASSISDIETAQKPTTRFKDSEINLYATGRSDALEPEQDNITFESDYDKIETGGVAGDSENGFKIASSSIPGDGKTHTHSYTLTMWVNESVTISDTDYSKTYRASATNEGSSPKTCADGESTEKDGCMPSGKETDDRTVYSDLYYSLKIKVEAGDALNS